MRKKKETKKVDKTNEILPEVFVRILSSFPLIIHKITRKRLLHLIFFINNP